MNERFREIIAEAGLVYWPNKELDRVAELIVQECADLLELEYGHSVLTGNKAAESIKKHFGIEE